MSQCHGKCYDFAEDTKKRFHQLFNNPDPKGSAVTTSCFSHTWITIKQLGGYYGGLGHYGGYGGYGGYPSYSYSSVGKQFEFFSI